MDQPSPFIDNELQFSGNFDSGNLDKVEKVNCIPEYTGYNIEKEAENGVVQKPVIGIERRPLLRCKPDYCYKVWTLPDAGRTPFQNGNRSWFYFSVRQYVPGSTIRISIMNMNRQAKLYSQGYTPLFKVTGTNEKESLWTRLSEDPIWDNQEGQFVLTFTHKFSNSQDTTTYFAFCVPWSYEELQAQLARVDKHIEKVVIYNQSHRYSAHYSRKTPQEKLSDIYYHREVLCYTLGGRRVDLLTISDYENQLKELEERFDPLLFPDLGRERPKKYVNKKVFIITARVHPGETPGSHMFNGVLEFLLRENDKRAMELRRMYVFKLIPMLNPDGVALGHYRSDTRGVNLNRVYQNPNFLLYPSIYAAKAIAVYHHLRYGVTLQYPGQLSAETFKSFTCLGKQVRKLLFNMCEYTGCFRRLDDSDSKTEDKMFASHRPRKQLFKTAFISRVSEMAKQHLLRPSHDIYRISRTTISMKSGSRRAASFSCLQRSECDSFSYDGVNVIKLRNSSGSLRRPTSAFTIAYMPNHGNTKVLCSKPFNKSSFFSPQSSPFPVRTHAFRGMTDAPNNANSQHFELKNDSDSSFDSSLSHKHNSRSYNQNNCSLIITDVNSNQGYEGFSSHSSKSKRKETSGSQNLMEKKTADEGSKTDDKHDEEFLDAISHLLSCDQASKVKFIQFCQGGHLAHPELREVPPYASNVQCYIDLHGHCTKRGCFCYGNCIKEEKQMIENVLYPRLVAANSAFFDFAGCNFTSKNMYSKDRASDSSKEGSGRVGIHKSIGITHCYTVEANYNSGRLINVLSIPAHEHRCVTPPGYLWGPMRKERFPTSISNTANNYLNFNNVVRPVTLMDYGGYTLSLTHFFSVASFEEMGRGLLLGALDMWGVNPWSRLSTNPCSDLLKLKSGTHRSIRSITAPHNGGPQPSKLVHMPSRIRQTELCNLKILRNIVKRFVHNFAHREKFTLIKDIDQETNGHKELRSISGSIGSKNITTSSASLPPDHSIVSISLAGVVPKVCVVTSNNDTEMEIIDPVNLVTASLQDGIHDNGSQNSSSCVLNQMNEVLIKSNQISEVQSPGTEVVSIGASLRPRLPRGYSGEPKQCLKNWIPSRSKDTGKRERISSGSVKNPSLVQTYQKSSWQLEIGTRTTKINSTKAPNLLRQGSDPKLDAILNSAVSVIPNSAPAVCAKPAQSTTGNKCTVVKQKYTPKNRISTTPIALQSASSCPLPKPRVPNNTDGAKLAHKTPYVPRTLNYRRLHSHRTPQGQSTDYIPSLRNNSCEQAPANICRTTPQLKHIQRSDLAKVTKYMPKTYLPKTPPSKSRSSNLSCISSSAGLNQPKPVTPSNIQTSVATTRAKRFVKKRPNSRTNASRNNTTQVELINKPTPLLHMPKFDAMSKFPSTKIIRHLPRLKPLLEKKHSLSS